MKQNAYFFLLLTLPFYLHAMENPTDSSQAWNGEQYEQHSDPQYTNNINYLKTINLTKYSSILDLGCGTGKTTHYIAQQAHGATVIGMDISANMIETAQKKYCDLNNLTFLLGDAQNFDLGKTFQLIISFAVFHYIEEKKAALQSIARALEPGGSIHLSMTAKPKNVCNYPAMLALTQTAYHESWREHFTLNPDVKDNLIHQEELADLIKQTNLGIIMIKTIHRELSFANIKDFKRWIKSWINSRRAIATLQEQQPQFIREFIKNYTTLVPMQANGIITYKIPVILAHAQKPKVK